MKREIVYCIIGSVSCVSIIGCSIAPPAVHLTGEKTLVENQIIGEYRELEPDAWAVSSVKTAAVSGKTGMVQSSDEQMFRALKIRELNEDAIRHYKNEGAIGETANGYAEYKTVARYESDKEIKKILTSVIDDENNARRTIFERSLVLSGKEKPTPADMSLVAHKFADEERSRAQKNDWIQGNDGQWQRKK
jgi:uncharacterized protein YdbL (DUF1318 family)